MARRRKPRRGALLLVVLSILMLFLLISIAFIVIASHYKRAARAAAKSELKGDSPALELEGALLQVLVGVPTGSASQLDGCSLLEDMYGATSGVNGSIASVTPRMSGQFLLLNDDNSGATPDGVPGVPHYQPNRRGRHDDQRPGGRVQFARCHRACRRRRVGRSVSQRSGRPRNARGGKHVPHQWSGVQRTGKQ